MEYDKVILNQIRKYIEDLRTELTEKPITRWPEAHEIYSKLIEKAYTLELKPQNESDSYLPN